MWKMFYRFAQAFLIENFLTNPIGICGCAHSDSSRWPIAPVCSFHLSILQHRLPHRASIETSGNITSRTKEQSVKIVIFLHLMSDVRCRKKNKRKAAEWASPETNQLREFSRALLLAEPQFRGEIMLEKMFDYSCVKKTFAYLRERKKFNLEKWGNVDCAGNEMERWMYSGLIFNGRFMLMIISNRISLNPSRRHASRGW